MGVVARGGGGGGGGIPRQSVPAYPTAASGDTDLCTDATHWADVGANAWSSFTSDGVCITAFVLGASKTSRSRFVLATPKAAAFDVSLLILPGSLIWAADEDAKLNVYLKTAADAVIAKCQIAPFSTAPGAVRQHVLFAGSGGVIEGGVYVDHGTPIVVRFVRTAGLDLSFQHGNDSTPFALRQYLNQADDTVYSPNVAGTLARIELEQTSPAGPGATARFGCKLGYMQSI